MNQPRRANGIEHSTKIHGIIRLVFGVAWSSTMPVIIEPNEAPTVPAVLTQDNPSVSDSSGTVSFTTRLPEANTGEIVRPVSTSTNPISTRLPRQA